MSVVQTLVSFFLTFFVHLFYPVVAALLEYLNSHNFTLVWFLLYNFVAVTLLALKLSKRHCYDNRPMFTLILKLFPYLVYTL